MCIICNMRGREDVATEFLSAYDIAREAMKQAKHAMYVCSKDAVTPEARAAYDASHKTIVRLVNEWNKLEQSREPKHRAVTE